ncbi:AAA family ATPase [Mucilaginibacter sp. SJ]|uniref:AAA family ATPase n=1 Tax=Mucilaginibacter sp. SJ TaxID=3029053 RepID=UPI0023AA155A|nr:AAA family ATPase [Mucilaginibacter sp. SJ]WEA01758.1 AAA family ATPase [Mucilaginibacter sp. SJ]
MPKTEIPFITIVPWRRKKFYNSDKDAQFYLEQDNWNDQGFYVSYYLHASSLVTKGEPLMIGHVRILKMGQPENKMFLLGTGPIGALDDDYCSMGTSLDYYSRISQLPLYKEEILTALRDAVVYPEFKEDFLEEPGFKAAMMRNFKADDQLFTLGPLLLERDYHGLLDLDQSFKFKFPQFEEPVTFRFDSKNKYGWNDLSLPNRIIAIIGRNGSGKSTLLSRISRVAFSSATDRLDETLQQVGIMDPPGLGFPRILVLSYSAFDAFNTPGVYVKDKRIIVEEMRKGIARYVFIGVRDIVSELEEMIPFMHFDEETGKLDPAEIRRDKIENTKLKTINQLGEEFIGNLAIIKEFRRDTIFDKAMKILSAEVSMHLILGQDLLNTDEKDNLEFFLGLSTGHKFVIHSLTSIIAYTAIRSLLLFDEPETHLHPPMLAALMTAVRFVLGELNAFMIVATHSPVVLQETLSEHVYRVRRVGSEMKIEQPPLETFGENIGTLTEMAFGLTSEATDFHNTLDALYKETVDDFFERPAPEALLERIEGYFEHGLSTQARAYLLSKIFKRG